MGHWRHSVGKEIGLMWNKGVSIKQSDCFPGCQSVKPSSPEGSCPPGKSLKEVGCAFWPLGGNSVVGQRVTCPVTLWARKYKHVALMLLIGIRSASGDKMP